MARARTLTPAQQDQVLSAADPMMASVMAISFHCGLRVATLAALDWAWLTGPDGALTGLVDVPAKATKKQRAYTVGLSRRALALIEVWWIESGKPNNGPVVLSSYRSFHQRNGRVSVDALRVKVKRLYRSCGLEASSHSGRRSCANRLLAEGADVYTVQAVLGHKDLTSVIPYVAEHAAKQAASTTRDW